MAESTKFLKPGRNCWRLAQSRRAAFLIDGEAYFAALAAAIEQARHSVLIVGWDIDSRVRLRRNGRPGDLPAELGPFLNAVVARRPGLQIYVLDWDFAMLYALEREILPLVKLGWRTHRRLHFSLDDRHPVGGSHHQKIVVVDDRLAFVGGFDLAQARWDTPEHAPDDPRRCDNGLHYPPFHDVQMMVDGEAAALLGDLARRRWLNATGKMLEPPKTDHDPWPRAVRPDLHQVQVAVARTEPAFNGSEGIKEIECFFREAIAAARSSIYIESQYLTSATVGAALASRLLEEKGPDIILILPRECSGWLEETTMGVLRERLLRQLRDADRFDRLKVYYPTVAGLGDKFLNIHSKVLVIDDILVRVGSSNLNNRSMGLDTECDLIIEADREETREAIAAFRDRLLSEHLGTEPERVAAAIREQQSILEGIEKLRGGPRSLEPLNDRGENWVGQIVPEWTLVDPERPMSLEQFIDEIISKDPERKVRKHLDRRWVVLSILLLGALGLTAAWQWTPLSEWVDLATLENLGRRLRNNPWAPAWIIGTYILGGMVMMPVTLLILATALTFPPATAFLLALSGSVASACTIFGLGHLLGSHTVRRLAGSRLNRLSRQLARRGLLAVVIVRFLPVAPFSIVNLTAGASHIRLRDFVLGTILGMGPGIIAITIFEQSLEQAIRNPGMGSFLLLTGVVAAVLGALWFMRRWLARKAGVEQAGAEKRNGNA